MITDFRLLDIALKAAVDTEMGRRDYGKDMFLLTTRKNGGHGQPSVYSLSRAECPKPWRIEFEYTHHYDGPPYSSFVSIKELGDTLVEDLTRLADERDAINNEIVTQIFQIELIYEDDPVGAWHHIRFPVTTKFSDLDQFFNDDHLGEFEDSEAEFGCHDQGGGVGDDGVYTFGFSSREVARERTDELVQRWHDYFTKLGWAPGEVTKVFHEATKYDNLLELVDLAAHLTPSHGAQAFNDFLTLGLEKFSSDIPGDLAQQYADIKGDAVRKVGLAGGRPVQSGIFPTSPQWLAEQGWGDSLIFLLAVNYLVQDKGFTILLAPEGDRFAQVYKDALTAKVSWRPVAER